MKVVVTGAAGFLGSHACQALVARGHAVVGVDAFDDLGYPAEIKRETTAELRAMLDPPFELCEGDVCDPDAMGELFAGADLVLHLAALTSGPGAVRAPLPTLDRNVYGTGAVVEACAAAGVDRLVLGSAAAVYGDDAGDDAWREDDPCRAPLGPYGVSKRAAELVAEEAHRRRGLGVTILRYFTIHGARQPRGAAIHGFARAIGRGEPVIVHGDGSVRRDLLHVDDAIAATTLACERCAPGAAAIYNLASGSTTSVGELVEIVERTLGRRAVIERVGRPAGVARQTRADVGRARRELELRPRVGIADGVARFCDWLRARSWT